MRPAARLLLALAAIVAIEASAGCSRKKSDPSSPTAADAPLPPITVTDDTPGLVLTWIDDRGEARVALRPADVPAAGRSLVRVVITDREEGTRDRFYVADLTRRDEDGDYLIQTMLRSDWEQELKQRRQAYLANAAASGRPRGDRPERPGQEQGSSTVIIYGASWCKPCHQAASYLKSKRVAYVMKDIDETPGAAAEMHEKLASIGRPQDRSIPVIDVRGQILVGFNRAAVDHALAKTGGTRR